MKIQITFCILFLVSNVCLTQIDSRGGVPLRSTRQVEDANNTYAVIIGVSEYRDSLISDLQFAHVDAQKFYQYLRSKEGGSVAEANIRLLLNEKATVAAIDDALYWIRQVAKKGDKVYFYFSGHGDVEQETLWQLGYLLAHDTPFGRYRNNAIRLEDINNIIKTIAVSDSLESKTIVIIDACRSGKLAGDDVRGSSLTVEKASKSVANEVRIMSCKPDQKSLESEKWGGGRGVFSYFLIKGLTGEADEDDKKVSLEEMDFYLRKNIKESLTNLNVSEKQNPIIQGNESFILAKVSPGFQKNATAGDSLLAASENSSIRGKGSSDELNRADSLQRYDARKFNLLLGKMEAQSVEQSPEFATALSAGNSAFFKFLLKSIPESQSAQNEIDPILQHLLQDLNTAVINDAFQKEYSRKIAIFIHDQGQQKLNLYLNGDAGELKKRTYYNRSEGEYERLARLFEMAEKLIEKDHPLFPKLLVKKYYFSGIALRLKSLFDEEKRLSMIREAITLQNKSLTLDDKTSYVHNELGILHGQLKDHRKSENHYRQAIQLSPGWAYPYSNLSAVYNEQKKSQKAKEYALKSISLNPKYALAYLNLGTSEMNQKNLLTALESFTTSSRCDSMHYLPDYKLAELYLETEDYQKADSHFTAAENKLQGLPFMMHGEFPVVANNVMSFMDDLADLRKLVLELEQKIADNPNDTESLYELGRLYNMDGRPAQSEAMFLRVLKLDPSYKDLYNQYGCLAMRNNDYEKAEILYRKALLHGHSDNWYTHHQLATIYETWADYEKAESHYKSAIFRSDNHNAPYFALYDLYYRLKRYEDAERILLKASQAFPAVGNHTLANFYLDMCKNSPRDAQWPYKAATSILEQYSAYEERKPKIKKYLDQPAEKGVRNNPWLAPDAQNEKESLELYRKAYELTSDPGSKLSILVKMSSLILSQTGSKIDYALAKEYIEKALQSDSSLVTPMKNYISIHAQVNGYLRSFEYLKRLHDQNRISFDERMLLCRFLIYSADYESAHKTLDQAKKISPFDDHQINALRTMCFRLSSNYSMAEALLKTLQAQSDPYGQNSYTLARMYARQNKKKLASQWLGKAFQNGFEYKSILNYDPAWQSIWSRDEWIAFLKTNKIEL